MISAFHLKFKFEYHKDWMELWEVADEDAG